MINTLNNNLYLDNVKNEFPVLKCYIDQHLSYSIPVRVIVVDDPISFLGELYTFTKYALLIPSNIEFKHYMENYFKPCSDANENHPCFKVYNYIMMDMIPSIDYIVDDGDDKWVRYSFDYNNVTTILYFKCYNRNHFTEDSLSTAFIHCVNFYDCLNKEIETRLASVQNSCYTEV